MLIEYLPCALSLIARAQWQNLDTTMMTLFITLSLWE